MDFINFLFIAKNLIKGNLLTWMLCNSNFFTLLLLNLQKRIKLDKMPCASLLFRVQQAPKTEDGLKVLSKEDVPEKDWEKKEVWIPAPPYGAGRYNTTYCNVRDSEKDLFYLRQQREDPVLRTTATILVNSEGITKEFVFSFLLFIKYLTFPE